MLGSSVLGVALLRRGLRPRASALLLLGTFPLAFLITAVTSMGSAALPISFAFALCGRQLAAEQRQHGPAAHSTVASARVTGADY